MIVNTSVSAEVVDKLGVMSFIVMTSLIFFCILVGFVGVYSKFNEKTWDQACIHAGGVPLQISKQSYDCKIIK